MLSRQTGGCASFRIARNTSRTPSSAISVSRWDEALIDKTRGARARSSDLNPVSGYLYADHHSVGLDRTIWHSVSTTGVAPLNVLCISAAAELSGDLDFFRLHV